MTDARLNRSPSINFDSPIQNSYGDIHVFDIHVSFPFDERESRSITSLIRSFFFLSFFSFSFEIDRVEAWNVITRRIFAASLVKYFITGSEPRIWMKYLDSREPRITPCVLRTYSKKREREARLNKNRAIKRKNEKWKGKLIEGGERGSGSSGNEQQRLVKRPVY